MDNKEILIIENLELTCEGKAGDDKNLYIEGIVAQSEIKNRNGRFYPRSVLAEAVEEYNKKFVETRMALGELNHPPRPLADPANATHRITEMKMKGNDVWARAIVLEDATKLRSLINAGWQVQASTRGLGAVKKHKGMNESECYDEVTKFKLTVGFDVVQGQSAPGALMDGVYAESGLYECIDGEYKLIGDSNILVPNEGNNIDWDLVFEKLKDHYDV